MSADTATDMDGIELRVGDLVHTHRFGKQRITRIIRTETQESVHFSLGYWDWSKWVRKHSVGSSKSESEPSAPTVSNRELRELLEDEGPMSLADLVLVAGLPDTSVSTVQAQLRALRDAGEVVEVDGLWSIR